MGHESPRAFSATILNKRTEAERQDLRDCLGGSDAWSTIFILACLTLVGAAWRDDLAQRDGDLGMLAPHVGLEIA